MTGSVVKYSLVCGAVMLAFTFATATESNIHIKDDTAAVLGKSSSSSGAVQAPPRPEYTDLNDTTIGNHTSQSVELNVPLLAAQHRSGSGGGQQNNMASMLPLLFSMMNQQSTAGRQDAGAGGAGGGGGGMDPAMMAMMMSMMSNQNQNQGSG